MLELFCMLWKLNEVFFANVFILNGFICVAIST